MTTTDKPLIELVEQLSPELRGEVRDFVEFLLAKQRRKQTDHAEANGWPEGFFEHVAGSITDPTFERPPQGDSETRLPLE